MRIILSGAVRLFLQRTAVFRVKHLDWIVCWQVIKTKPPEVKGILHYHYQVFVEVHVFIFFWKKNNIVWLLLIYDLRT